MFFFSRAKFFAFLFMFVMAHDSAGTSRVGHQLSQDASDVRFDVYV